MHTGYSLKIKKQKDKTYENLQGTVENPDFTGAALKYIIDTINTQQRIEESVKSESLRFYTGRKWGDKFLYAEYTLDPYPDAEKSLTISKYMFSKSLILEISETLEVWIYILINNAVIPCGPFKMVRDRKQSSGFITPTDLLSCISDLGLSVFDPSSSGEIEISTNKLFFTSQSTGSMPTKSIEMRINYAKIGMGHEDKYSFLMHILQTFNKNTEMAREAGASMLAEISWQISRVSNGGDGFLLQAECFIFDQKITVTIDATLQMTGNPNIKVESISIERGSHTAHVLISGPLTANLNKINYLEKQSLCTRSATPNPNRRIEWIAGEETPTEESKKRRLEQLQSGSGSRRRFEANANTLNELTRIMDRIVRLSSRLE